jgi:hypothetical protein
MHKVMKAIVQAWPFPGHPLGTLIKTGHLVISEGIDPCLATGSP